MSAQVQSAASESSNLQGNFVMSGRSGSTRSRQIRISRKATKCKMQMKSNRKRWLKWRKNTIKWATARLQLFEALGCGARDHKGACVCVCVFPTLLFRSENCARPSAQDVSVLALREERLMTAPFAPLNAADPCQWGKRRSIVPLLHWDQPFGRPRV